MKRSKLSKGVLSVAVMFGIAFVTIAYRWTSHHIWFPLDHAQILVNGSSNPMLYDYLPGKSLNGDIFFRNQDHGPQYLISFKKQEVSIISEDADFMDIGFLTYTRDDLVDVKYPRIKTTLSNPNLVLGNKLVEFTSTEGERWHVSY